MTIEASPFATDQAWADSYTAELTLTMVVSISSIIDLLVNEVSHPRTSTIVVLGIAILLLFAGFQSRGSRRRVAAQMALLDALSNEINAQPSAVVEIPSEVEPDYEDEMDDDIELV